MNNANAESRIQELMLKLLEKEIELEERLKEKDKKITELEFDLFNVLNYSNKYAELESPILPPLILEKLKKGEEYYLFAKKLFNHVDKEWSELLQKNYWFFYWDKVTKQTSILNQIGFDCTNV